MIVSHLQFTVIFLLAVWLILANIDDKRWEWFVDGDE